MTPFLRTEQVQKSFGGVHALDGCSVELEQGTVAGRIGPNGSGKTTLFNVITGYERVDGGEVYLDGRRITDLPPERVFSLGIGRTFQLTRIFPRLTVLENMLVADPAVMLLDEPAGGVNPSLINHIAGRIRDLNAKGKTFLIVEHNMDFVMNLCGRVTVMDSGGVIASGRPEIIRSDPRVLDAYLGGAWREEEDDAPAP